MDYTRFINTISDNETHHGKLLLHYLDSKTLEEELRLYRFSDFIKFARENLRNYEHFELKDNTLYNFQLFIHAPDKEKTDLNIRQHSTTMTLLYRIFGGHNIKVKKGEKINVIVYDHTRFDSELKIIKRQMIVKNPNELFEFKENDVIKVLENTGSIKTLTIVKSYQVPYFNFATNPIVPTDKWKIPKSLQSSMHHSMSYIVNRNLFYKFPDDTKNQYISFAVYIYNNDRIRNRSERIDNFESPIIKDGESSDSEDAKIEVKTDAESSESSDSLPDKIEKVKSESSDEWMSPKKYAYVKRIKPTPRRLDMEFENRSKSKDSNSSKSDDSGSRTRSISPKSRETLNSQNSVYHKCMVEPEVSRYMDHYNGKCCVGSKYAISNYATKSIIENINIEIRTINHYYFNEDFDKFDLDKYPSMRELKKICNIQKYLREKFMERNSTVIKYVNAIVEEAYRYM